MRLLEISTSLTVTTIKPLNYLNVLTVLIYNEDLNLILDDVMILRRHFIWTNGNDDLFLT